MEQAPVSFQTRRRQRFHEWRQDLERAARLVWDTEAPVAVSHQSDRRPESGDRILISNATNAEYLLALKTAQAHGFSHDDLDIEMVLELIETARRLTNEQNTEEYAQT